MRATAPPSPLWGGVGGGGIGQEAARLVRVHSEPHLTFDFCVFTPPLAPPHQGEGKPRGFRGAVTVQEHRA